MGKDEAEVGVIRAGGLGRRGLAATEQRYSVVSGGTIYGSISSAHSSSNLFTV